MSEKSSFSQTCNLLRQFLKENRSIGELGLGMNSNLDPNNNTKGGLEMWRPVATTMDLFPISSRENKVAAKEPEAAQMTIFYNGRVIVVDDLCADKAKEIMLFASQLNQGTFSASTPSANAVKDPTGPSNTVCATSNAAPPKFDNNLMPDHVHPQSTRSITCDLPIQRKASLHRFLEKRKDRIHRSAPYQKSSTSKPAETDHSTFSKPEKTNHSTPRMAVERDLLSNLSS